MWHDNGNVEWLARGNIQPHPQGLEEHQQNTNILLARILIALTGEITQTSANLFGKNVLRYGPDDEG